MVQDIVGAGQWSSDDVRSIGKWQRAIILMLVLNIMSIAMALVAQSVARSGGAVGGVAVVLSQLITVARLGIAGVSIYCVYRMAKVLRQSPAVLYAVLMIIPLAGLIVLVVLNSAATRVLRQHGVKVGFLGADQSDLDSI